MPEANITTIIPGAESQTLVADSAVPAGFVSVASIGGRGDRSLAYGVAGRDRAVPSCRRVGASTSAPPV